MNRQIAGFRKRKGRYLFVSILSLLAMLVAANAGFAATSRTNEAADDGRVYKNLFEYKMCDAQDPNWCPGGENFRTDLFEAMFADPDLGHLFAYSWWDGTTLQPHYRDVPGKDMTRYTVDLCETGDPDGNNKCPDAHGFDVVTCTDGTRPVFYYEQGAGADANKWIFKIQGGGDDCGLDCPPAYLSVSTSDFGSAFDENPSTRNAAGLFSNSDANMFKDYSMVMLDKCVGDRNLGDVTVPSVDYSGSDFLPEGTGPVYFHGYRIILAVLKQLERDFDLADAEEILFVTQSNGSNGAYHYIDRLSDHITQDMGVDIPVRLLAQSFVNPGPEVEYFFETGNWPAQYSDVPSTTASPGYIHAPDSPPYPACGDGFDPSDPDYVDWIDEGRTVNGGKKCGSEAWQPIGGADGRAYATEDFASGYDQGLFDLWGVDNGVTETWDESCVQAHAGDDDLRACRDTRHVLTHHLQTPVFFAAQIADRNLRTIGWRHTEWVVDREALPVDGAVWSPLDMKLRVEKLAEVITGYQSRSACADADIANHGFFIDNTVDHMGVVEMSKLTRQMKANTGEGDGANFQLQEYLKYWMDSVASPTVQCLDSNDLYDVEFTPPFVKPGGIDFPVENWPLLVQCKVGYYEGGTQPYQPCDDPGFADPLNLTLNRADPRFVCESPPRSELTVCASGCDYDRIQAAIDGVAAGGTILLAAETFTETFTVDKILTLVGAGPEHTIVQAAGAPGTASTRVVKVEAGANVTLEGLTIRYGNASGSGDDGRGGGILNQGKLTLKHTYVLSNSASLQGGGIYSGHTDDTHLDVLDSFILDNESLQEGGGIYNDGSGAPAYLIIEQSTVASNSAATNGGGILNDGTGDYAYATVENSTITGNSAQSGGGVGNKGTSAKATITHSTLSNNSASTSGGNLGNLNGTVDLATTILANSPSGSDCASTPPVADLGYNLVEDGSCGFPVGGDPLLGALQDNGGPTWTHALLAGSPALDSVPAASCAVTVDQRGVARPQDGGSGNVNCDIGAYELGTCSVPVPPTLTIAGKGNHAYLDWNMHAENRQVEVWRGSDPYDSGTFGLIGARPAVNADYFDAGAIGDPDTNNFYAVRGQNACGDYSTDSNQVGEVDFSLEAAMGDLRSLHLALISLPLEGAGLPTTADGVAEYVDSTGGVRAVAKWNPQTQSWIVRRVGNPFGTPDFAVSPGDVLLLGFREWSLGTFAWTGDVPAAGAIQNDLMQETYNVVIVPLDQNGVSTLTADGLAPDIGGVTHVAMWNVADQRWEIRVVGISGLNFAIQPGHPYFVRTDNTAPLVWP